MTINQGSIAAHDITGTDEPVPFDPADFGPNGWPENRPDQDPATLLARLNELADRLVNYPWTGLADMAQDLGFDPLGTIIEAADRLKATA